MSLFFTKRRFVVKPPPSVAINWSHPLTNGLIWLALPGSDHRRELVSGGIASLITNGKYTEGSVLGNAFYSSSTSNGGVYYPWTAQLERITNSFSIVVWARIDALTNFAHLLSIPYSSSWSSPYFTLQYLQDNATGHIAVAWTISGGNTTALGSAAGGIATGAMTMYGTCVDSNGTGFYKNGVLQETSGTGMGGNLDFGNKREVILLNHNSADPGEGITGITPFAAIWNRKLTDSDMQALYLHPFSFFSLPRQPFAAFTPAAASTVRQLAAMGVG